MTGEKLRSILLSIDESFASVARKLNMTAQNLDGILKTKDIKTGLIERLSIIYNKPVSYFFDETSNIDIHTEGDLSPAFNTGDISYVLSDAVLAERIKNLETRIVEKDKLIDEKNARIDDLKERISELKSN